MLRRQPRHLWLVQAIGCRRNRPIALLAGALQYLAHLMAVWRSFDAPASWTERVAAFWFDTTRQDWRESMVCGIRANQTGDRLRCGGSMRASRSAAELVLTASGVIGLGAHLTAGRFSS